MFPYIITILILDNTKIDRTAGSKSFQKLVDEGLLLKDYFIITNTHRPILSFAKVLPTNDDERELISKKLRVYSIQLADYIELSRSIGISNSYKLSTIGIQLFTKLPYSIIYQASTSTSQYNPTLSLSTSSSTNAQSNLLTTTTTTISTPPSIATTTHLYTTSSPSGSSSTNNDSNVPPIITQDLSTDNNSVSSNLIHSVNSFIQQIGPSY